MTETTTDDLLARLSHMCSGDFPRVTRATYERAVACLVTLMLETDYRLPPPHAAIGPAGEVAFTWREGVSLLSLEVAPRCEAGDLLHLDAAGGMFTARVPVGAGVRLPRLVIEHLEPFCTTAGVPAA